VRSSTRVNSEVEDAWFRNSHFKLRLDWGSDNRVKRRVRRRQGQLFRNQNSDVLFSSSSLKKVKTQTQELKTALDQIERELNFAQDAIQGNSKK
jgi:hypothetical protein